LDGILIANEIMDDAKKSNKDLLLFKVDFEKAYDSVNFLRLWRSWIMECVSTATASVLVMGVRQNSFVLKEDCVKGIHSPLSCSCWHQRVLTL
jgi:hypothetical protein